MMVMKTRIHLVFYMSMLTICLSESLTQRSLEKVESAIEEYVKDLVSQDDGEDITLSDVKLLGRKSQKREQGSAGLWGRKRQDTITLEEPYNEQGRDRQHKKDELWVKNVESSKGGQNYGSAGLWGKRQSNDPIANGMDDFWNERELKKPVETGLWGKRARKESFRLEREMPRVKKQSGTIGLWKGKRGGRAFNTGNDGESFRKRIRQSGKTGLWGRNAASRNANFSGRKAVRKP